MQKLDPHVANFNASRAVMLLNVQSFKQMATHLTHPL